MSNEFEPVDREWEERLTAMANALPKERETGRMLEERTVAALRKRGLLKRKPARRFTPAWLAGSIAASIALFASGVVVGQMLGSRATTNAVIAMSQNPALRTAAQVQRTGSAYVDALQALAQLADSTKTGVPAQGREVALTALHAAANEVIRMAPNDPIAAEIMRGFERVRQQQTTQQQRDPQRQIIWF
jgi:hypothetical protein